MKILFVTSYPLEYNTSANIRNLGLIQGLMENGHQVSTFSTYPNDPILYSGKMLDFPFEKRYWIGPKKTIVIDHTKKTIMGRIKVMASSILSNVSVYDSKALMTRFISNMSFETNFDFVISSSDPKSAHLFAEKLIISNSEKMGKWIQYWGDPFTNDISVKHKFSESRIRKEENRLISLADKVVYVSPFTYNEMASKYSEYAEKMAFLPIPFYKKESGTDIKTEKNLIGYLGDYHSKSRNILPFVEAVKKAKWDTVIAGTSDLEIASTDNLTVYGRLHGMEIDDLAVKVGIYVCICNLHGTQIPGKVYHFVDSGKPILIILDGEKEKELREYFEGYHRFYLCSNNVEDISQMINKMMIEYRYFDTPESLASNGIAKKFLDL